MNKGSVDEQEERELKEWFRAYGPPALDTSRGFTRMPAPFAPRHRQRRKRWELGGIAAAAAAVAVALMTLPHGAGPAHGGPRAGSHSGLRATPPSPKSFSYVVSYVVNDGIGSFGAGAKESGTRIADPKAYAATRWEPPIPAPLFDVQYYVVPEVRRNGQWSQGWGGGVNPGLPPGWVTLTSTLAVNDVNHTQLLELGVMPKAHVGALSLGLAGVATGTPALAPLTTLLPQSDFTMRTEVLLSTGPDHADPHHGYLATLPVANEPYAVYAVCRGPGHMTVGSRTAGTMTVPCNGQVRSLAVAKASAYDAPQSLSLSVGSGDTWELIVLANPILKP